MDLPSVEEREEIVVIHINAVGRDVAKFDVKEIANEAVDFTGAEIEGVIKEAMFNAFYEDREINTKDIVDVLHNTIPIAKTKAEEIEFLRNWAKDRARIANGKLVEQRKLKNQKRSLTKEKHWEAS